ncbi:MAG: T9SS type A sorting domain-containing protein [Candidatus Eiseniibacteriota bacterium]
MGGGFSSIGGQPRKSIAAISTTSGLATTWNPGADGVVHAIAVSGSTVYVGGRFTTTGGQPRSNIAALDSATGAATTWSPHADSFVLALAATGTTVYAGGSFNSVGGEPRNNIAALDVETGAATSWDPGADNIVSALAVVGSTVYVGGHFTSISGQQRAHLAALDAATGSATSWDPGADSTVLALAVSDSTVYAGGLFTQAGSQPRSHLAALHAVTGSATSWRADPDSVVSALAVSGATVYAGGTFTSIGGQTRSRLAALDAGTGAATAWDPVATGPSTRVSALAVSGSIVYVGGRFDAIGGRPRENIAALDAVTGAATAWNPGAQALGGISSVVHALVVSGSSVCASGSFVGVGGIPRANFAVIKTSTRTTAPLTDPSATTGVRAYLQESGSRIALESAPNPFELGTEVRFALPAAARVRVDVFDVAGRRVSTPIEDKWLGTGEHRLSFVSDGLPSGVYWCRLQAGVDVVTRKLVVRR